MYSSTAQMVLLQSYLISLIVASTPLAVGLREWLNCLSSIQQRYITVFSDIILEVDRGEDILLVDPAYHSNAGDTFIVAGEERFLKLFPVFEVKMIPFSIIF